MSPLSTSASTIEASPQRPGALDELARRLATREAAVAVVGLGYVGLPLLLAAADAGFPVVGIDADASKIAGLRAGRSHIVDVSDDTVAALAGAEYTTDPSTLALADVILIAVPTPLLDGLPDLSLVVAATDAIAANLHPGQLVVLESTTYPGTTDEVLLGRLEETGLRCGIDFALAYSPERVNPGGEWSMRETPKVVGGVDTVSGDLACAFYGALVDVVHRTRSAREAEMAKLIENTFRQVNIALVNELATVAPACGVDLWDALDAAATKPFGYMPFWPGAGVGGHCIAVDPSYLSWSVERHLGFGVGFISHARTVNNRMPVHVTGRIIDTLNDVSLSLRGSRIHLLGLTYKPGVNDVRESPALLVAEHLATGGAELSYSDPYVETVTVDGNELHASDLQSAASADLIVLLVPHDQWDPATVVALGPRIFDVTGRLRGLRDARVVLL